MCCLLQVSACSAPAWYISNQDPVLPCQQWCMSLRNKAGILNPVRCRLYLQTRGHRCMVHVSATQQQQQKRYVTKSKRPAGRPGHHRKGTAQVDCWRWSTLALYLCSQLWGLLDHAVLICFCALLLEQEPDRSWRCAWHFQHAAR